MNLHDDYTTKPNPSTVPLCSGFGQKSDPDTQPAETPPSVHPDQNHDIDHPGNVQPSSIEASEQLTGIDSPSEPIGAELTADSITNTHTAIQALEAITESNGYFSPVALRAFAVAYLDDLTGFDKCREAARAMGVKGDRLALLGSAINKEVKALEKARAVQTREMERQARAAEEELQEEELQQRLAAKKAEEALAEEQALAEEMAIKPSQPDQGMANEIERPSYMVHEDWTEFGKPGVYYHGMTAGTERKPPVEINQYICDPLYIDAGSCDLNQNNFGLMLRFKNRRGNWRKWLMPLEMLKGSCEDLRGLLLGQGLSINPHARGQLPTYLQAVPPEKNIESALRVGWHDDCFILPEQVIGNRDDIYFQTNHAVSADYGQKGTLEDWQHNISRYCVGNPLLIFQVSAAFAGALLKKCHIDYAGFHIPGDSSSGKSTGQEISCSVWGGENFGQSWKATANGLEAAAVLHNDGLLALDELSDSDPNEVNQIIYALGNGTGKQRANADGTAKPVHKWRIVLLSNGEKTLAAHLEQKGLAPKAGQSVRLAEIPIFGKFGAFDDLHGMESGRLFADTLKANTKKYYGTAGIAYLEKLVATTEDLGRLLELANKAFVTSDMEPQELRVARTFALIALAGELATNYGVTGWQKGDAKAAAIECFKQWRQQRGTGSTEHKEILEKIRDFTERYGDTRFTTKSADSIPKADRAGWFDSFDGERVWLFTSGGLKEATKGYDIKRVILALKQAGWLTVGSDGNQAKHKIRGETYNLYQIITE